MPLVVLGTLGSLLFASVASTLIASAVQLPPYLDFGLEWRTLLMAVALAALALLVVGVLPAWKVAQQHLLDAFKDGGQHVSRALDRAVIRRVMVAAQVAGSCLLLIIAGMMVRSVQRLPFSTDWLRLRARRGAGHAALGRYGITGNDAQSYWYTVKDRVNANPEVQGAAIVTAAPLGTRVFENPGPRCAESSRCSRRTSIHILWFMRIPILSGRVFTPTETGALVVSRRLALEDVRHRKRVGRELSEVGARWPLLGDGRCRTENA